MESRYHCTVCEDFDQCAKCHETRGHEHRMELLTGGEAPSAEGKAKAAAADAKSSGGQQKPPKPYIELYLNTFMHAVNCRNANCTFAKCMQFKRVVQHSKQCQKFKNSQCEFCRQLIALCIYHAKSCKDDMCQVPLCSSIKIKLKQQKALNHQAERRRMLMMNKTLRQSANHAALNAASSAEPAKDEEAAPSGKNSAETQHALAAPQVTPRAPI
jgi:E1A/CREB-binding protein